MAIVPNAILELSPQAKTALLTDPGRRELWEYRERCRVEDSFVYFLTKYGSHTPADGSGRHPLTPWAFQIGKIAARLEAGDNLISVKARRVGMTLVVVHYMVWLAAFAKHTPSATILAVSFRQEAADDLLAECHNVLEALPDFLRPAYGSAVRCKQTATELGFKRGSKIKSLPANDAARGKTARFVFLDEFARIKEGGSPQEIWEGAEPTIEGGGQLVAASTGRGRSRNGKKFADLWDMAEAGEVDLEPVFIHWRERPGRDDAWYAQKLKSLGDKRCRQEYPSTSEEALAGDTSGGTFDPSHLRAAEKLGDELYEMVKSGQLRPMHGAVRVGIDWGNATTASVVIYPLPGFGILVADEFGSAEIEAQRFTETVIDTAERYGKLEVADFDPGGSGAQAHLTFKRHSRPRGVKSNPVPFGKWKRRTVDHIRLLLLRTFEGEERGVLAIAPTCVELRRQLRAAKTTENQIIEKVDDHYVDALIAGTASHGVQWRRTYGGDD